MIVFRQGECLFNYRVSAVLLQHGRLLVHRAATDDFWTLPGGRCEMDETAPDAVRRELREELGVDVTVGRLLWVGENFFTYAGERYHELGLYFEASLPDGDALALQDGEFFGTPDHDYLLFRWVPVSDLSALPLLPQGLCARLAELPAQTGYFVEGSP